MPAETARSVLAVRFNGTISFAYYTRLTTWHRYSHGKKKFNPRPAMERDLFQGGRVGAQRVGEDVKPKLESTQRTFGSTDVGWVYAFRRKDPFSPTVWFAELIDNGDGVQMNPATRPQDRLDWSPGDSSTKTFPRLPSSVAAEDWLFGFVAAPFRLNDASVDALTAEVWDLIEFQKLADMHDSSALDENGNIVALDTTHYLVPVTAPVVVAQTLSDDVREAASLLANVCGHDGEEGNPTNTQLEKFYEYSFCKSLVSLMQDPDMGSKVRDELADDKKDEPLRVVRDYEFEAAIPRILVDAIGHDLATLYDSRLFTILINGYVQMHSEIAFNADREILLGLSQTAAGLRLLERIFDREDASLSHTSMFTNPKKADADQKKIFSKSKTIGLAIGAAFLKALAIRRTGQTQQLALEVYDLFELAIEGKIGNITVRKEFLSSIKSVPGTMGEEMQIRVARLEAQHARLDIANKALTGLDVASKVFDTINVGLAIQAYTEAAKTNPDLRFKTEIGLIAAGATALSGWIEFGLRATGRSVGSQVAARSLGLFGVALSTIVALVELEDLERNGDDDAAAVLFWSIAVSAGGAVVSFLALMFGLPELAVLAAIALATGALLYLVHMFLVDEPLFLFLQHCAFGELPKGAEDKHPSWSTVPLNALSTSWKEQARTLALILQQYEVGYGEEATLVEDDGGQIAAKGLYNVRIFVGAVDMATSFLINWSWKGSLGEGEVSEVVANSSAAADVHRLLRLDKHKQTYFDVEVPRDMLIHSGRFTHETQNYGLDAKVSVTKVVEARGEKTQIPPKPMTVDYKWPGLNPDIRRQTEKEPR